MNLTQFYELLSEISKRKPFRLTPEGAIRQCKTGMCPILAVAYKLNPRFLNKYIKAISCAHVNEYVDYFNRELVGLRGPSMEEIIGAADEKKDSKHRRSLLKAVGLNNETSTKNMG